MGHFRGLVYISLTTLNQETSGSKGYYWSQLNFPLSISVLKLRENNDIKCVCLPSNTAIRYRSL